ncbi:MAG: 4Fe-4S ferredoxin [Chloroflexota bacterium]|nr:4Fe-4S ferredoxin [Chloroflexota bacterium]
MAGRDTLEELRAHVAEKLQELDGVVALRRTVEGTAPHLFRAGSDLSQLTLAPRYPLASTVSLLQKRYPEARFGVVARGCDIRALVEMAKRNQVDPDWVHLLGVACTAEEAEACHCADPVPDTENWPAAVVIGTPVEGAPPNPIVAEYEKMSLDERREFWQQQFLKCIKCYGCRNFCPVCFCEACALEDPLWVEPGVLAPSFPTFHLIKAMHMSSRCVACRQCELACPAHIPLTVLYDLIRRDIEELLGYVPGADIRIEPPLSLTLSDAPLLAESELL